MNVYSPPGGSQSDFLDDINHVLQVVNEVRYSDLYLLGDVNLDHTPGKQSEIKLNLENSLRSFGLEQCITCPTRRTGSTKTLIDVMYIRTAKKIKPFIIQTNLSDHYTIGSVRYLDNSPPPLTSFKARTYKKYNLGEAKKFYDRYNRSPIYNVSDINLVWETLLKQINKCANTLCPLRTITVQSNRPAWISDN